MKLSDFCIGIFGGLLAEKTNRQIGISETLVRQEIYNINCNCYYHDHLLIANYYIFYHIKLSDFCIGSNR